MRCMPRPTRVRLLVGSAIMTAMLVLGGPTARPFGEEAVFPLKECLVLDEPENSDLPRDTPASCKPEPLPQVRKYPPLKSKHPWYGEVVFDRRPDEPKSGKTFTFVLDESRKTPEARPEEDSRSVLGKLVDLLSGKSEADSKQAGNVITYDRLYFDLNGDLDLTNDPVLKPLDSPPPAAVIRWPAKQKVVFGELTVPLDGGPGRGMQSVRLMPRLALRESQGKPYATVLFLPLAARRGTVQIGSRQYTAVLGQPYSLSGRFDLPTTYLRLIPSEGGQSREYWWGSDTLSALRWDGDRFYQTRATPGGDSLLVAPYRGELGTFKIGPGSRKLDHIGISGSLRSRTAAVPIGKFSGKTSMPDEVQECQLPVGDYVTTALNINYSHLRIFISENYHADGERFVTFTKKWVYGVQIRKEKPFVLDFSNKPEVLFVSPGKEKTFHPGDEIQVKAVLIDPVLDIMIRELEDTKRKKKETVRAGDQEVTSEHNLSLDPTVTIRDASGKTVAEGPMPFG